MKVLIPPFINLQMEKETTPRVVVIPYFAQGHINPALAFAKCLASKGVFVTFIITTNIRKSAKFSECSSIAIHDISDGSEEVEQPESMEAYFKRIKTAISRNLAKFIDEHNNCAQVIVYDSVMPWILDIAHERGLLGASFFTICCSVSALSFHLNQGSLRFPYVDSTVSFPALPELAVNDLPSYSHVVVDSQQTAVEVLAGQFSNLDRADWIFFNTFDELEHEVVEWMRSRWPIKTVGPTMLLMEKDEKNSDEKKHMINLFDPKHEACKEWLELRETGSVVYASFGSLASLGEKQMEEVAYGLIMSNCYFLLVVRSSEVEKLPDNLTSLASEKGLIVEWCDQPQVLAHRALACFMTHCGWNSTLEALSNGVPLIAMAQWAVRTRMLSLSRMCGELELELNVARMRLLVGKKLQCVSNELLKEMKGLSSREMLVAGRNWLMKQYKMAGLLRITLMILFQNSSLQRDCNPMLL